MAKKGYQVKVPFRVDRDTELKIGQRVFPAGAFVVLDDKVAKNLAAYLVSADEVVETATAGPGEKRVVKKPASKKKQ